MRALLITSNGVVAEVQLSDAREEARLLELQRLVGGYIEGIAHPHRPDVMGIINEEGKLKRLPVNKVATRLFGPVLREDDVIVGPCVLIGVRMNTGDTIPLPDDVMVPR